jgi:hypothetical protein
MTLVYDVKFAGNVYQLLLISFAEYLMAMWVRRMRDWLLTALVLQEVLAAVLWWSQELTTPIQTVVQRWSTAR